MQERFEFLAQYRHVVPEEDFEVAMKAYEWPKKFVSIMKEAATKATSGRSIRETMPVWLRYSEDPPICRCPIEPQYTMTCTSQHLASCEK